MDCIIIDDDSTARLLIREFCAINQNINILGEFDEAHSAQIFLKENKVDFIFLDIHMPIITGIDLLKTIQYPPLIVMTTSDPSFAVDAFQYDFIVDYLVKPISFSRFSLTISKIEEKSSDESHKRDIDTNSLYIIDKGRITKINYDTIYYIEANGDYLNICTSGKRYIVHSTLKKIKEKLTKKSFIQVHRSYIINMDKILEIEDTCIKIDKSTIPLSRSNKTLLLSKLNLL